MSNYQIQDIGRDKAIALAKTKWWIGKTHKEIAKFGLFTRQLCCPFQIYHEAVETALGRPVFTHEFAFTDNLIMELLGEKDAPTMQEIIDLLPHESKVILIA